MLRLREDRFVQLREALVRAFQSPASLRQFVQTALGGAFASISQSEDLDNWIEAVIAQAEDGGIDRIRQLVDAAYERGRTRDLLAIRRTLSESWFTCLEGEPKVLDAAIRRKIKLGNETTLLALIRGQDSDGLQLLLQAEPDYEPSSEDVRTSPAVHLTYPRDEHGNLLPVSLRIVVEAPDFEPAEQSKPITVEPCSQDETRPVPIIFRLTPLRIGKVHIYVSVYYADNRSVDTKPITTECLANPSQNAQYRVLMIRMAAEGLNPQSLSFINQQGQTVDGNQVNVGGDATIGQVGATINTDGGDYVGGDKFQGDKILGSKLDSRWVPSREAKIVTNEAAFYLTKEQAPEEIPLYQHVRDRYFKAPKEYGAPDDRKIQELAFGSKSGVDSFTYAVFPLLTPVIDYLIDCVGLAAPAIEAQKWVNWLLSPQHPAPLPIFTAKETEAILNYCQLLMDKVAQDLAISGQHVTLLTRWLEIHLSTVTL